MSKLRLADNAQPGAQQGANCPCILESGESLTSCSSSYKVSLRTPKAFSLAKAYKTGEWTLSNAFGFFLLPQILPQGF